MILNKADIDGMLTNDYPCLSPDDCDDIKETFNAMRAALEAWVKWHGGNPFDESNNWLDAIELTKAAGVEYLEVQP